MSEKNLAPVPISPPKTAKVGSPRYSNVVKSATTPMHSRSKKDKLRAQLFPDKSDTFDEPEQFMDQKFKLICEISDLNDEINPLRKQLYAMRRNSQYLGIPELNTEGAASPESALDNVYGNRIQVLNMEYEKLSRELETLQKYFAPEMQNVHSKTIHKQRRWMENLKTELEELESELVFQGTDLQQSTILRAQEITENQKLTIKELKLELESLHEEATQYEAEIHQLMCYIPPSLDTNDEYKKLQGRLKMLQHIETTKRDELKLLQKNCEAQIHSIIQFNDQQRKTSKMDEERKSFSTNMKVRKREAKEQHHNWYVEHYCKPSTSHSHRSKTARQGSNHENNLGKDEQNDLIEKEQTQSQNDSDAFITETTQNLRINSKSNTNNSNAISK